MTIEPELVTSTFRPLLPEPPEPPMSTPAVTDVPPEPERFAVNVLPPVPPPPPIDCAKIPGEYSPVMSISPVMSVVIRPV